VQRLEGTLVLSATDLVGYLACDHLATLELGRVAGLWERPHRRDDPTIEIIQEKGDLHERAYLESLRGEGLTVAEISKADVRTLEDLRRAAQQTIAAMRAGADVIYQATFFDGRWRGHADFLFRRDDRPSSVLGPWSYDIADTKLARAVKAGAVLQMCVYAALLEAAQGIPPEWLTVITGDRAAHRHRAADFSAYFRYVRDRFEARIGRDAADPRLAITYPNPVDHCRICPWSPTCIQRRRDDDHLSMVAGMRRVDTERLKAGGLPQLAVLARAPSGQTVKDMPPTTFNRLRNQARLQLHEREHGERVYELMEPNPDRDTRGLGTLPEPSNWDVFFDIEADPWAGDDGLEYLLGIVTVDTGQPVYRPIWGTDLDGERKALGDLFTFLNARMEAHPELHVFHYGGYESGALKRLVGRHGFGAEGLDRLLRGEVLFDLLNVVRQGVRASVESYSLKQIEKFYLPVREGPVTDAGFSVVEFERWLRQRDESILDGIASYNRDDCVSTWMLRGWLEARRVEAMARWPDRDWTRPALAQADPTEKVTDEIRRVRTRVAGLTAGLEPADDGTAARSRRLLANLLDWHRREEKSQWWRWYELTKHMTLEALVVERDALSGLEFVGEVGIEKKSVVLRYRFEPQDHPFGPGDVAHDVEDGKRTGEVFVVDDVAGTIDIKRSFNAVRDHPKALVEPPPLDQEAMKVALLRVADALIAARQDDNFAYRAIAALLARRPPSLSSRPSPGEPLDGGDPDLTGAARRLALALDHAVLPIQGPPGTGKTYTAARMITSLVQDGKRVGITAQSHRTISNLIEEVLRAADAGPGRVPLRIVQRAGELDPWVDHPLVTLATSPSTAVAELTAGANVVAGTAWQMARADMDQKLDVLFVDEAGQSALANVIAAGTCAKSIVLVGDPNQLPMVTHGVHPEGVSVSGLAHLLGEDATIPADRGLFLGTTRRLHPDVNAFVSDAFYERRLIAHPDTRRVVLGPAVSGLNDEGLAGAGVRWQPVVHSGNGADSEQEAAVVANAVAGLVGRTQRLANGTEREIGLKDVIVITPYNAQVAEIQKALKLRLGATGNVGTVDKFQGREGVVAIYSMASSSRDDAPRDMGFLYSRNRLNVAVSRAESIAIVVASPALLEAGCRTPEQMRLVDALCRYVEVSDSQAESLSTANGVTAGPEASERGQLTDGVTIAT
jgi:predicted RecB family nuclease